MNLRLARVPTRAVFVVVIFAVIAVPPLLMATQIYPVSVVDGNSMYPTLSNGDMVLVRGVQGNIANGSIILFIQGGLGVPALDALVAPVVIHRVVAIVNQSDGTVYYRTKGDNNRYPDQALVRSDHVLGVPVAAIPKVGIAALFLKSPQGLVTIVAAVLFVSLSRQDAKSNEQRRKEEFLAVIAERTLNGEIDDSVFRKFELAVRFGDSLHVDHLKDHQVIALADWLKRGGLRKGWQTMTALCPSCGSMATIFGSRNGLLLTVCPKCR
jgi:signal peptidase I